MPAKQGTPPPTKKMCVRQGAPSQKECVTGRERPGNKSMGDRERAKKCVGGRECPKNKCVGGKTQEKKCVGGGNGPKKCVVTVRDKKKSVGAQKIHAWKVRRTQKINTSEVGHEQKNKCVGGSTSNIINACELEQLHQ